MNADCPMLSRPVEPKGMFSPMTAIATAAVVGSTAMRSMLLRMAWMSSMARLSLLPDPLGPAEQTLRPHQQEQDENEQCRGVLEVARDDQRRELHDEADDQGADQCAERRAETAEGHGREQQQQDLEAGVPLDAVDHERIEEARQAGQGHG